MKPSLQMMDSGLVSTCASPKSYREQLLCSCFEKCRSEERCNHLHSGWICDHFNRREEEESP